MDGQVQPGEVATAIDGFPDISVLSLDCFDTLLWRDCHAPSDVFATLPGLNTRQRVWAERAARIEAVFRRESSEVMLPEIYRQLLPNADADMIDRFVATETAAEAAFCHGFAPTIALMRRAKARGLKVVIVSDTYLDHKQLAALIASSAGSEVRDLIDAIFCSSEFGVSKTNGLLGRVVEALGIAPADMLHIGDNPGADYAAAKAAGICALHMVQFSETAAQRLRQEAAISAMLHTRAGPDDLAWQPHRACLAITEPTLTDEAVAVGYTTLGPLLAGFADWLEEERAALQAATSGKVHMLFLMRDGYLPRAVYEAVPGRTGTSGAIEISRFTATGMAFVDRASILRFVEQNVGSGLGYLLAQLLFTPQEVTKTLNGLPTDSTRSAAFMRVIGSAQAVNRILSRSRALAERMCTHIRACAAPARGDTLLLVDLGYNGSVQNVIEPVLRPMLGVNMAGRYLLYRAQQLTGYDKSGLIDDRHYDFDTLLALSANVAVLEQLCTVAQGSVVDYAVDGTPRRAANIIKGRQSVVRNAIQDGCVAYARDERAATMRASNPHAAAARRRSAAAIMGRLMFLPQKHELDVIARFEHDVNLGTTGTVKLFDPDLAKTGMRQRGLFYMKSSDRMYLPAELHGQGLPVSLAMFALKRFNLGFNFKDFCDHAITLSVLVADGKDVVVEPIEATPTHDGYFVAVIPIGAGKFTLGVQFGQKYDVVEILSVQFRPTAAIFNKQVAPGTETVAAEPTFEGMDRIAPGLFRCVEPTGFMMVPPPAGFQTGGLVLEVVFRPLVDRCSVADPISTSNTMGNLA